MLPLIFASIFPVSIFGLLISVSGRLTSSFALTFGFPISIFFPFNLTSGPSILGEEISTFGPFKSIPPPILLSIFGTSIFKSLYLSKSAPRITPDNSIIGLFMSIFGPFISIPGIFCETSIFGVLIFGVSIFKPGALISPFIL